MLTTVDSPRSDDEDESPTKRKGKRRGKVAPLPEFDPPTLGEYLLHLFDLNQLRSLKPEALTDAQFYWLLQDLGLGLSSDEVTVLCRRAPAVDGKINWASFAPRAEELLIQTFRTRDWNAAKRKGESVYARLQDPRNPTYFYFYNRQNAESEWENVKDEEQAERTAGFCSRPKPTLPPAKEDKPGYVPLSAELGKAGFRKRATFAARGGDAVGDSVAGLLSADDEEDDALDPEVEAKLRKLQAQTATKQRINRKRPPPPPLALYLELVLEAADVDRLGRLSSDKFIATMGGMGLGLQKADLNGLVRKATADTGDSTHVSWKPFSQPGTGDVWLTEVFSRKDFKKLNDSPWVRLYDPRTGAPYFMHRISLALEWVTGELTQSARMKEIAWPSPLSGAALVLQQRNVPPSIPRFMESMFTEEGKDEPGELSHEELFWMFKNLGLGLSSAEAKELVASVDADANGRVTWAVFADLAWTHLQSLFQDKEFDEENDANPWCLMYDPDSGGKYYFNRQSGDKEWVAGAKAQLDRIQQEAGGAPPFMGVEKMVRPPPPTLEEYLQKMFLDHDAEDTGEIATDAVFHLLHVDASLGLSEDECHNLVAAGDQDGSGVVGWEEFLPTACDLIAEVFEVKDWEREPTHWVKLFDRTTQEWYFFNRLSGDLEWHDGSTSQCNRVGIFPMPTSTGSDGNPLAIDGPPEDPDADGMPLPFGGRQLLDALALGQEDRARALFRHFRTDRRRARVLGATRVGRFGFTAAHVAAAGGCGIELVQDVLHLAPQLVDLPALNGDTPLHVACLWNKRNTARLLVALGAQVTAKNADGETPLDLAPPKLAARLVRDLNTILASWKGPVPYPNPAMGDELAATEGQQKRKAQQKAMQEAEAAAQAKAQENAALLEEENNKKAQEAIAKANRIANGQMNDEDYYEEGDEEEQLSNVQKWLLTAPTVESIEQAGAEVTAPNELVIRIYGATGLFPPEPVIRTGVRPEKFNEQLRPATFLVANRGNVDLTVQNPGAAPSSPTSAAAMAPNANNGGNFNGFSGSSNNSSGTSSGVPLVAATAVHGNQRGENWQQLGQTGWVPEANVLLDRTQGPNPNRAEGVDPTLYKDAMTEAQQNSGGSDGTALNPIWGEQFTIPDPYFVLSQIALGCEAQEVADGAKGRRRRRARLKAGKEAWEQGHYNGGYGNSLESLQSVTGVGPLNLKLTIAHWPAMDNQKRAAQRKAKKRRKDSSAHVAPTLDDALPLATCKVLVDRYTHKHSPDESAPPPVIPAYSGGFGGQKEFRCWLPLDAPTAAPDAQPAGEERRAKELKALESGVAVSKHGGRPPEADDPAAIEALQPNPLYVEVPEGSAARGTLHRDTVTKAWAEVSQEIRARGSRDVRQFLTQIDAQEAAGAAISGGAAGGPMMMLGAAGGGGGGGAHDEAAGGDSDDWLSSDEEGDGGLGGGSIVVGGDDDGGYFDDPLLGLAVRVRDPQAQEKAKQKMAGGDAFHSSSALVATDSSNGGASSSPPGAVLSLQKAYPLMAAKLQLGEFAGFVKEEATGEQDDCYVLLDASRQDNDFEYGTRDDEDDGLPAPLRRNPKPRRDPPVSDSAVTIFRKQDLSFVPDSYGALQIGLFWRYNPRLPPAVLPEQEIAACMEALFLEVLVGAVAQVGNEEFKRAQDAPFSVQDWQGEEAQGEGGLLETMQSQQLMQMQLMQQMQKLQLQQLEAVQDGGRNAPPPVVVAPPPKDDDDDDEEEEDEGQGEEAGADGEQPRKKKKKKKKKLTPEEIKAEKDEAMFRKNFVSVFENYEGERFPIGYLQPADVAVLFEAMGMQRFAPKVLEHPVDGPTLAVLTNEDFQLMGMELPGMRRRLRAEIELFLEQGCPMAAEVNYDSLQTYTEQFATLQQLNFDDFQDVLAGHPPQPDPNLMMQMQLQMMQGNNNNDAAQDQTPPPQAQPPAPVEDPEAAARAQAAIENMNHATPPSASVSATPPGSSSSGFSSSSRPTTGMSPEYKQALEEALEDLPKVFVAKGEKGKTHKVREEVDLMSAEHATVKAGEEVLVETVATAINAKGNEVDRYRIGAPSLGWITADNYTLVLDKKKQTDKYIAKMRSKLKGKDKKAQQKAEKAAKAAEAARKKALKNDIDKAKKEQKKEREAAEKAAAKAEKDAAAHQAKKDSIAAQKEANKRPPKAECYGAWTAKGHKSEENKLRFKAELDSMVVGKILGGQKVNVIGEATVKKPDGSEVRRLNINTPKAGWVTAANFDQAGQKKKGDEEEKGDEAKGK